MPTAPLTTLAAQFATTGPRPWLVIGAVVLLAWSIGFAALARASAPRLPRPDAETSAPGIEAPATANLLTHRWSVTRSAASATLVDLAARHHLRIERIGEGTMLVRVPRTTGTARREPSLVSFEQSVLELVSRHAVNDTIPVPALLQAAGPTWFDDFRHLVEGEAIAAGLARRRWTRTTGVALWATLAVALLPWSMAYDRWNPGAVTSVSTNWVGVIGGAALIAALATRAGARRLRGLSHTAAGRTSAAHWLGVKRSYQHTGSFGELQADAVQVWDRHLAYACALDEAPAVAATFPIGPDRDDEVWSPATGRWRSVPVAVPRGAGPPQTPGQTALSAAWDTIVATAGLVVTGWLLTIALSGPLLESVRGWAGWFELALHVGLGALAGLVVFFAVRLWRRIPVLVSAIGDRNQRTHTDGMLVATLVRTDHNRNGHTTTRHYSVVDDARGTTPLRAFAGHHPALARYRQVRVEHSPRLRYVYSITELAGPDTTVAGVTPAPPAMMPTEPSAG